MYPIIAVFFGPIFFMSVMFSLWLPTWVTR